MNAPRGMAASRLRKRSWVAGDVGNRKRTDVPSFMRRSSSRNPAAVAGHARDSRGDGGVRSIGATGSRREEATAMNGDLGRRGFLIAAGGAVTGAAKAFAQAGAPAPGAAAPEFRTARALVAALAARQVSAIEL